MPTITFAYPWLLATALLIVPMLWYQARRRNSIRHSGFSIQKEVKRVPFVGYLPTAFMVALMVLLAIAIAQPQLPEVGDREVIQARDIVIAVDISGSMSSEIKDPDQRKLAESEETTPEGEKQKITKIFVAEKSIENFVASRPEDRIGLMLFDDEVYYSWPLSTDHKVIQLKNQGIRRHNGGGTNFQGDGVNGKMGPLQGAIEHFKELGQAKTKILVMVTDGEASISEERFAELMEQLHEHNIKIYTIGVGDSWLKGSSSTNSLRKITEASGGLALAAGDAEQMREGFRTINALEKSSVERETTVTHRDIYHLFLMAALVAAVLFLVSAVLIREDT